MSPSRPRAGPQCLVTPLAPYRAPLGRCHKPASSPGCRGPAALTLLLFPGFADPSWLLPAPNEENQHVVLGEVSGDVENGAAGARGGTRPPRGPCTATCSHRTRSQTSSYPPSCPPAPAEPAQAELGPSTSEQNLASAVAPAAPPEPPAVRQAGREQEPTEGGHPARGSQDRERGGLAGRRDCHQRSHPQAQGAMACHPRCPRPRRLTALPYESPTRGARSPCSTANTELWPRWAPQAPGAAEGVSRPLGDRHPGRAGGTLMEFPVAAASARRGRATRVPGRVLTLRLPPAPLRRCPKASPRTARPR